MKVHPAGKFSAHIMHTSILVIGEVSHKRIIIILCLPKEETVVVAVEYRDLSSLSESDTSMATLRPHGPITLTLRGLLCSNIRNILSPNHIRVKYSRSYVPSDQNTTTDVRGKSGWNLDIQELNQEIQEICGSFIEDPLNNSSTSTQNPLSENQFPAPAVSPDHQENVQKKLSHVQRIIQNDQRDSIFSSIQKNSNLLLIYKSPSLTSFSQIEADVSNLLTSLQLSYQINPWDGSLTSLLSIVSQSSKYDSVIIIDENPEDPINKECLQILQIVERSSPVVLVNKSSLPLKVVSGVDFQQGIFMALFGLSLNK